MAPELEPLAQAAPEEPPELLRVQPLGRRMVLTQAAETPVETVP